MGRFDFGIQFLDADKMTYWGKHRDADFWIENASVEWSEAEAPFHTVARLTLLPRSRLGPEESDATYFDVTGHSTPDSTPLGSINRARWPAEVASRKARLTRAVGSQETLKVGAFRLESLTHDRRTTLGKRPVLVPAAYATQCRPAERAGCETEDRVSTLGERQ